MSHREEPWVRAAMSDDAVVAEILVRLHKSSTQKTPATNLKIPTWAVRQRRSKLSPHGPSDKPSRPRRHRNHRASPSTPLSWSAGSEDSTRSCVHVTRASDDPRSKEKTSLRPSPKELWSENGNPKRTRARNGEGTEARISTRVHLQQQQPLTGHEVESRVAYPPLTSKDAVSLQRSSRFSVPDLNIPLEEDTNAAEVVVLC